jgi:hypothetical protein
VTQLRSSFRGTTTWNAVYTNDGTEKVQVHCALLEDTDPNYAYIGFESNPAPEELYYKSILLKPSVREVTIPVDPGKTLYIYNDQVNLVIED